MAKDPVCGREVDERTAAAASEYQGRSYYFCALSCKEAFDREPERYIRRLQEQNLEHSGQR